MVWWVPLSLRFSRTCSLTRYTSPPSSASFTAHSWVFGSWYGTRFSGSPRALFVHCLRFRATEISVTWISRRRELVRELRALGLPAYHRFSVRGLWLCLRAGVYVFDCRSSDINYFT